MSRNSKVKEQAKIFLEGIKKSGDSVSWAMQHAYVDMSRRTLHFTEQVNAKEREELSTEAKGKIEMELKTLARKQKKKGAEFEQGDFDKWHKNLSKQLCNTYEGSTTMKKGLTYGQTQKWINMTLKYLWTFELVGDDLPDWLPSMTDLEPFMHIPLDRGMLIRIEEKHQVKPPENGGSDNYTWSRIICYYDYIDYQNEVRKKLENESLAAYELREWNSLNTEK